MVADTHFTFGPEQYQQGKVLRKRVPRSAHAAITPGGRDAVALLEAQDRDRYPPLVPVRYGRMLESPFAFLRGAAAVMAHDLAATPRLGNLVQACGDCHLLNFGAFVTGERRLVFDINDFDETLAAPWEWDVKRLAASVWVAGRHRELRERQCRAAVLACARAYRERMTHYARAAPLEVWLAPLDAAPFVVLCAHRGLRDAARVEQRALHSGARKLPKLAGHDGERRIADEPPLLYHPHDRDRAMQLMGKAFDRYRTSLPVERRVLFDRYHLLDVAIKVVGVGSVGWFCAIALFEGPVGDVLFLQMKQARRSVLGEYVAPGARYAAQGERVVVGERLMQSTPDPLLGWSSFGDPAIEFYVRRLRDVKIEITLDALRPSAFTEYVRYCAWALAHAHARSGDAALVSGYLGASDAFDHALCEFARGYADQTDKDHASLEDAVASGRVAATCER